MDNPTLEFYGKNAPAITEKYREAGSGIALFFPEAFPWKRARILDIGCGSGRDLQALLDSGHDAFGCEPVPEMRQEAIKAFPKLESRIFPYGLPLPEKISLMAPKHIRHPWLFGGIHPIVGIAPKHIRHPWLFGGIHPIVALGTFQGILCSAVFMHLPPDLIPPSITNIQSLLDDDGRLLLSFPENRSGLNQDFRDAGGRLFHPVDGTVLSKQFQKSGFQCLKSWENRDSMGREGLVWRTMLFLGKKRRNGL